MRIPLQLRAPLALSLALLFGCSAPVDAPDPGVALTGPGLANGAAGPPREGSGTGLITSLVITSSRVAGPNVVQERRLTGTVTGTLEGTFVEHVRGVIHGNGLVTFQGTMEFTGILAGCGEGTLTLGLSGTGQAGLPVTETSARVIDQGAGTLAAAGTGSIGQVGPNLSYEIRYTCR